MIVLNIFQFHIIQTLKSMHKAKYGLNPRIFFHKCHAKDHQYQAEFSQYSFYYKKSACKISHVLSFLKQIEFKLLKSNKET